MDDFKPDDIIRHSHRRDAFDIKKVIPAAVFLFLMLLLLLVRNLSLFYSIGPDEVGVVRRFGRYIRTTPSGLHFKIPLNIEKVDIVKVKHIFKEEFGFRTANPGIVTEYSTRNFDEESLMLTGDLNVIIVEWIIQYKIKDPVKYLFNIRNPRETIQKISEAIMRQIIGDNSVNEILTARRVEINQEAQEKLQNILDSYNCGIHVVTVKLQDVNPPDPVKPSFNEVNEAKQEKEKLINQAWEAYNKMIPLAKGEAEKTIREAEGYALNRINKAKGDAEKFILTWEAYKEAKNITSRRLFLEAMNDIMPAAGKKYIIDSAQEGILPLLKLGEGVEK